MLYHLVWLGYDLLHFHGLYSLFWIGMGLWGFYRAWKWHRRRRPSYRQTKSNSKTRREL